MSAEGDGAVIDSLFSGVGVQVSDTKFFRGRRDDVISPEEILEQAKSACMQQLMGTAIVSADAPRSHHPTINVRDFVAQI
ncbi:MAG: hypothetical protein IOC49_11195 [Methylobacterium sp.]|nr:hypothetical protein [Methylobacterium sp.]